MKEYDYFKVKDREHFSNDESKHEHNWYKSNEVDREIEKLQKELEDIKKYNEELRKGMGDIITMIEINLTYSKKWCVDDINELLKETE